MDGGCCVLFRNLKKGLSHRELRTLILQLLNEVVVLEIPLRERDISIEGEPDETKIALVYCRSKKDLDRTLQFVDSYDNRRRLTFNFDDIIEPSAHCAVIPIFHRPNKYFIDGEILQNSDGSRVFKSGIGSYINIHMKEDLSRFICACLNSGESKTFFVGVQENGCVVGVPLLPQKEDIIWKDIIANAVIDIKPPVLPGNYHADFVPMLAHGIIKDGFKVIEVTVNKKEHLKDLYEIKGDYYIGRDGGKIEPMKPKDVQQWYRNVYEKEIKKKEEEKQQMIEQISKSKARSCRII